MPKATKHSAISTSPNPTQKAKSQSKVSQATRQALMKAIVPSLKPDSKIIKKGSNSKENKPPAFGKSRAPISHPPKKPSSSWIYFSNQMHSQMSKMEKFKGCAFKERTEIISESWKKLNQKQKQQYVDLADEDKVRYIKETKEFCKKGYFINQDGMDSRKLYTPSKDKKDQKFKDVKEIPVKVVKPSKTAKPAATGKPSKFEMNDKDDTVKPKQVISAYLFYGAQARKDLMKENPNLKFTDVTKQIGQNWSKLTDDEKKPYHAMYLEDSARLKREQKELSELGYFTNSDGVKSTFLNKKGKTQEFENGTVMPKGVVSGFIYFNKEYVINFKKAYPEQKIEMAKLTKESGNKWGEMNSKDQEKYYNMQKKDQLRYNEQLSQIRKNGFFTNEDGIKSTDLPIKQKYYKKAN